MATGMNHSGMGFTRRLARPRLVLGSALALTFSCGGSAGSGTDSNTHWLTRCSDKEDCGGLECLCGLCTKSCDTESQCRGLSEAVCEPIASCSGSGQSTSVCTAECSGNAECTALREDLACIDGRCESTLGVAGAAGAENTPSSGGTPSGGTSHSGTGGSGGSSTAAAAGSGAVPSATGGAVSEAGAPSSGGSRVATGGNDTSSGSGGSGDAPAVTGGTANAAGAAADGGAAPSSGGTVSTGGSTASEAGAGGAPASGDRLVLDPSSLIFYALPINSIRYAVTGYDPSQRTCATLVWEKTDASYAGAFCDVYTAQGEAYFNPYVVLETDTDGPCTDADWDYQGNVETTSSTGCVDFAVQVGTSVDMVDMEIGVQGTAFTGTIVAKNRPEGMVAFGLEYFSDVPENVYVQTGGDLGLPEWLHVTKGGEPVGLFDRCDVPNCGTSDGVCGIAFSQTANITGGTEYSGSIYLTWDGQVWSVDELNQCLTSAPASAGTYQVEVCYGSTTRDSGSGPVVQDPVCETQEFTYPTDRVTVTVDNGG